MTISPDRFLLFDGAMGTMLQARGLRAGELPERLNLTHPDIVRSIHAEYVAAGADVITANTFGANARKLAEGGGADLTVEAVVSAAVKLAREAGAKAVALDVGPTGALLEPLGTLSFDEAYALFAETVRAGAAAGADVVLIETMSDLLEAKAALLAAKENCDLPVFVTMTFSADGRTFLGTDPKTAAVTLSALGADAVGLNCSLGPTEAAPLVREILDYATVPVMVQPNAGLPRIVNCDDDACGCGGSHTVYDVTPTEFVDACAGLARDGVTIFGGCCGTNPAFIAGLRAMLNATTPAPRTPVRRTVFTGTGRTVELNGPDVAVIGERINPTGKKRLKEALRAGDDAYVVSEAISQQEAGADILDVNAGLPELDEAAVLRRLVSAIQAVSPLPLQIDSSDPAAIEAACRVYCGKPIINSVNGKEESLAAVLPIAKKYGAAVVGLTLDENGIPDTAEERFAIAARILDRAVALGIPREDVLIDCLTLTASTNQALVRETLRAVSMVKRELGLRTVLGVSNVSFGLPAREVLNANFLAAAFGAGLDMPILNPLAPAYRAAVASYRVLNGQDAGAVGYIEAAPTLAALPTGAPAAAAPAQPEEAAQGLTGYILTGRKKEAAEAVTAMLTKLDPMEVINGHLIPALDEVGARFEQGRLFLPQLIAAADAAKSGFEVIRATSTGSTQTRGQILLATVKGDIHDIGKNIVRMLLENYGYAVLDLGRDVAPEAIVEATLKHNIKLVGLSALMTTTVKAMQETITALRAAGADCKVMVGGAVLTPEYAEMVGADYYAKDAAEGARIAGEVLG
ncbi:MAG: homocysteine S-methyltransferase family protein [Clostridia bacterium]|nr:homocysteine S-methyltransferase family protein [Clostridia bacterium]